MIFSFLLPILPSPKEGLGHRRDLMKTYEVKTVKSSGRNRDIDLVNNLVDTVGE